MSRRLVLLPFVVVPWLAAQGCRTATEVTLDITINACADLKDVDIIVSSSSDRAEDNAGYNPDVTRTTTTTATGCQSGDRVGTLVVTPDGDRAGILVVAGIGVSASECKPPLYGPQCIVARRAFSFTKYHSATLPIALELDCKGVPCNAVSTCLHGQCVDASVDCSGGNCSMPGTGPSSNPVDGAPPPPFDGGPGSDGGPRDAASDGSDDGGTDAMVDGGDGGDGGDVNIGIGSCPPLETCLGAANTCPYQPGNNQFCCYETLAVHCSDGMSGMTCNGPKGCCRKASDCPNIGDVCCASTVDPTPTTTFMCRSAATCPVNQQVCQTPNGAGECVGAVCFAMDYGAGPGSGGYKRCK